MQDLTYARYLEDPSVRTAIDDEVAHLRSQAIDRYLVEPVRRALLKLSRPVPSSLRLAEPTPGAHCGAA